MKVRKRVKTFNPEHVPRSEYDYLIKRHFPKSTRPFEECENGVKVSYDGEKILVERVDESDEQRETMEPEAVET